jgi:hypothetical protein
MMKMSKNLALLILSLGAAANVQAMSLLRPDHDHAAGQAPTESAPAAAPEIDPASAMSAFTLLTGGLVLIRGRRSNK